MSVYDYTMEEMMATYKLKEHHNLSRPFGIYGSSRVGMKTDTLEMIGAIMDTSYMTRTLGKKQYEMSNHLGNVLTVVSDAKIPVDYNSDNTVDYYLASIVSATDYTNFGAPLSGRDFNASASRYGFGGMEKDDEIAGEGNSYTTEFRQYDPRIGRWLSPDPLAQEFSWQSPYVGMDNNPIKLTDPKGTNTIDKGKNNLNDAGVDVSNIKIKDPNKAPKRLLHIDTYKMVVAIKKLVGNKNFADTRHRGFDLWRQTEQKEYQEAEVVKEFSSTGLAGPQTFTYPSGKGLQVDFKATDPNDPDETEGNVEGVNVAITLNNVPQVVVSAGGSNILGRTFTREESLRVSGGTLGYQDGAFVITVNPTAPQVEYTVRIWKLQTKTRPVRRTRFKKLPQT